MRESISSRLLVISSSCLAQSTFHTASSTLPRFGSFTSTEGTGEYIPIDDVEKLERYRPGGYHPITIGAWLKDQYRIVHKLGFGTYSTVWLARDEGAKKYVAIKITIAAGDPIVSQESNILRQLGVAGLKAKLHAVAAYIPRILDEFSVSGPNGIHRCFVTAPGMMSLAEAKDASSVRLFQLPVARAIAAQLVQAVAFLHSQGIVHAGEYPLVLHLSLMLNLQIFMLVTFYSVSPRAWMLSRQSNYTNNVDALMPNLWNASISMHSQRASQALLSCLSG